MMSDRFRMVCLFVLLLVLTCAPRAMAQDCDNNGIADADELSLRDCNRNGVIDACDLSAQTSPDCNGNGLPDECDVFAPCAMEPSGFAGGDGTPGNPYLVCTPVQLDHVRNHLDAHFRQIADIDMLAFIGLAPIPSEMFGAVFTGSYDGDGYAIRNLSIVSRSSGDAGLFSMCGGSASLRNIRLENASVGAAQIVSDVGALVGEFNSDGEIMNCHATNVQLLSSAGRYKGGLIGLLSGAADITRCSTQGVVGGNQLGGGLIGRVTGAADIRECSADVFVGINGSAGGLIGTLDAGSVAECYSAGRVAGIGPLGGLIAVVEPAAGPVTDCYWDLDTSTLSFSAAGTGLSTAAMQMQASFAGWNFDTVWAIDEGLGYPQLRRPEIKGTADDCNTNGLPDSCELISGSAVDCNGNGLIDECDMAPPCVTEASGFAGGDGTPNNPYRVCSAEQLDRVCLDLEASYLQTRDIDLATIDNFIPIGTNGSTNSFTGSFDGAGLDITGLRINSSVGGLFRNLGDSGAQFNSRARIESVNLVDARIESTFSAGGIVVAGAAAAVIVDCHVGGVISGNERVGGIIGVNSLGTFISLCSSSGSIVGDRYVGGLSGESSTLGFISNCYSEASISISSSASFSSGGTLFGRVASGNDSVVNCYGVGLVTGITNGGISNGANPDTFENCFWDTESTGQLTSGAFPPELSGGRTTAEMQMQATYEPEWDFENVWTIDEGNDYPRLRPYRRFVLGTETDDNGNGLIDSCDLGGDLDGDGAVTVADIPLFVNVLLTNGNGTLTDLNRDYRTNGDDLPLFLAALVGAP